jgi:hypothetical protein
VEVKVKRGKEKKEMKKKDFTPLSLSLSLILFLQVMIFYEIVDLEMLLDTTDDPIADIVNAACSDIVAFVAVRDYSAFVGAYLILLSFFSSYFPLFLSSLSLSLSTQRMLAASVSWRRTGS